MQRLLDAGVDFHAAPTHIPWLSLLWSAAYAFFIWKISSRLLQGPQDEGVGKGRDKINLKPYGALSFDDSEIIYISYIHCRNIILLTFCFLLSPGFLVILLWSIVAGQENAKVTSTYL